MSTKTYKEFMSEMTESMDRQSISEDFEFRPSSGRKTTAGHTIVGQTYYGPNKDLKGANILQHKDSGKYFASGGANASFRKTTTLHDTPEEAAANYHKK